MREIILHTFQWNLKDIIKNLDEIKECGYTAIQITPIQEAKQGDEWWTYYQPLNFKVGNKSGSREDLIKLCSEAKKLDIKIIVDVVLRHCGGTNDGKLVPHENVDNILKSNPKFWTNAENTTDYEDRYSAIHGAFGMPMLDYDNTELQDIYIDFLTDLKNCGVSGFRCDMGKHFGLKEEGSNFWERVFGQFKDMFNYIECLDCSKELLDEYTKFTTVLTNDNASDQSKMVIFIMSHDTELTFQSTIHITDDMIKSEWDNLLKFYKESHVLFYVRPYSNVWKSAEIKKSNLENK